MKKIILAFLIISVTILTLYVALSMILLNGRFTYITTFTETTIEDSKKQGLFVTDSLYVEVDGDSTLRNWRNYLDIWTNKRYMVKYYGIIYNRTFTEPNWRYLTFHLKKDILNSLCREDGNYYQDLNNLFVPSVVGDTLVFHIWEYSIRRNMGIMKIVVR